MPPKLMKTAIQKTVKKNAEKNREDLPNQKTKTVQMKSGNPSGFPGKFKKINSQTVAWITVLGADISYPVVQAADDEYY